MQKQVLGTLNIGKHMPYIQLAEELTISVIQKNGKKIGCSVWYIFFKIL